MFQQRQIAEVNPLTEFSFATATPGAVANGTTVAVLVACTLGATGSGFPATFALGDQLEVYASAAAATNGINVSASPSATPGSAYLYFQNQTGGSITPVAGAKYTLSATRLPATLVS